MRSVKVQRRKNKNNALVVKIAKQQAKKSHKQFLLFFIANTRSTHNKREKEKDRETTVPLQSINMLAVKNFFLPERTKAPETPQRFSRMPEAFLRSIRRRSLRVKRAKSLVVPDREKRKSGEVQCRCKCDQKIKLKGERGE